MNPLDSLVEPKLQARATFAATQKQDAEPYLAQNDRVDDELALVVSQPLATVGFGSGFVGSLRTFATTR